MIWTKAFWQGAAERAIKTAAQTLVALLAVSTTGLIGVDWAGAGSVVALAAILSVVTSIGNADFTAGDSTPGSHAKE
jgi:hypothetical protein